MEFFIVIQKKLKLKKIIVIDFLNKGNSHANFNDSFLKSISNSNVTFVGNLSHVKNLKTKGVKYKPVKESSKFWQIQILLIFIVGCFSFKRKNIVFVCSDNYIVPFLTTIFFSFFIGKKITMILHNNITPLLKSSKKRIPLKVITKLFAFNMVCLTLEGQKSMQEKGFGNTSFIPHMNFSHIEIPAKPVDISFPENKTNVVFIGRQAKFFVEKMMPLIKLDNLTHLNFIILYQEEITIDSTVITQIKNWIDDHQLNFILKTADFSFFHNYEVQYRPSGVLLDCITHSCPIIAPRYGHFNEFSNSGIGYFYSNIEELIILFQKLNNDKIKRSNFPQLNFEKPIQKTSIEIFGEEINALI